MQSRKTRNTAALWVLGALLTATGAASFACSDMHAQQNDGPTMPPNVEQVAPGFEVQFLYEIPLADQGSWVSLAVGPDGSLYASDQGGAGIYRVRIGGDDDSPTTVVEKVAVDISGAQGMVWAFDSLYANVNGTGLYRLRDVDGDGDLDTREFLGISDGQGEHGIHGVLRTEDGQALYFLAGNFSALPDYTSSTITNWKEDLLLPREWAANGHSRGVLAPGGYVVRLSPDGTDRRVHSIGFRNLYSAAINPHGELFTFDSDSEADMGSPWYRTTRIVHVVSGSDMGWRSGTGNGPPYLEDNMPPVLDVGPASPTGVLFGTGARFPARYQNALFALDWTYSTIYALHLTPKGASYTAELEEFVSGSPLTVTDAVIGHDGHLYFVTGGRSTQSGLYRVVYRGHESTAPAEAVDTPEAREARELRRRLESFHGRQDPAAVDMAWPYLSSQDRFLRHAARVAIEWQPVQTWASRALNEPNPQARITSVVALARNGTQAHRAAATRALLDLDMARLTADQKLGMLRAFALVFMRLGDPTDAERTEIIDKLNALLPDAGSDDRVNTELIRDLIYLRDDEVTAKAMALVTNRRPAQPPDWSPAKLRRSGRYGGNPLAIVNNPPPSVEINFVFMLRNHREGWTTELRRQYFEFLNAAAEYRGGANYAMLLGDIRDEALRNSTVDQRAAVSDLTGRTFIHTPEFEIRPPQGPGREWTVDAAIRALQVRNAPARAGRGGGRGGNSQMSGRNFEAGRNLFFAVGCAACHRLNEYGGDAGPDLTAVAVRYGAGRILEKIIDPNNVISDQYLSSEVTLANGQVLIGLPIEDGEAVTVHPRDPHQPAITVPRTQVRSIERMDVSLMPPGLINSLNAEELRDLMAYLMSGGRPDSPMFAPASSRSGQPVR